MWKLQPQVSTFASGQGQASVTLPRVRALRILLLVSLTLMLPIRGVMAAAMLCPPSTGVGGEMHESPASAGEHGAHVHGAEHHGTATDDVAAAGHHHDTGAAADTCHLCSACCSVPPVPSAAPSMPQPHARAAAAFPAYSVPVPLFVPDAQERPPRST